MVLNNVEAVEELFGSFYELACNAKDSAHIGVRSVLGLHYAFYCTCGESAVPYIPKTFRQLLRLAATPALDAELVELTFSTAALILQEIASSLLRPEPEAVTALKDTWLCIASIFSPGASKSHIRKAATSVWAGVIRKARGKALERLMRMMLDDARRPGVEGIWVESLKGTSDGLHSRATFILDQHLDRLAINPVQEDITSISKILTAVVHHCSSKTLLPVADVILARISPDHCPKASLPAMLALLTVLLATRQGKRFPRLRISECMRKLIDIMSYWGEGGASDGHALALRREIIKASIAILLCGQLSDWLSPGVKVINALWKRLVRKSSACQWFQLT